PIALYASLVSPLDPPPPHPDALLLHSIMHTLTTPPLFSSTTPSPTNIHTPPLHDALPISTTLTPGALTGAAGNPNLDPYRASQEDLKSTRLNSSHRTISYAVFCLKKKKHKFINAQRRLVV